METYNINTSRLENSNITSINYNIARLQTISNKFQHYLVIIL